VARHDSSINTLIGPGTQIEGRFYFGGFTRIDGYVKGDLDANGSIVIGERARLYSNIRGTKITIGGVVYGDVLASESLSILSSGIVIGNCLASSIRADEGSVLHGKMSVCAESKKWEQLAAKSIEDRTRARDGS
jgi:cytoskeletal protein CcmA (bactofilin family)